MTRHTIQQIKKGSETYVYTYTLREATKENNLYVPSLNIGWPYAVVLF